MINEMTPTEALQTMRGELEAAIVLSKCQKCGCMAGALENLAAMLPAMDVTDSIALAAVIAAARPQMRPIQYACLGCEHCYPAVAQNAFYLAFPALSQTALDLSCEFRVCGASWPPVVGEYFVLDKAAPVAVSTLASVQLAADLAQRKPKGLALVGKTETENIGLDKIIKNVITSPTLRYLIVAGRESSGHLAGQTLLALAENGVDTNGRVLGSSGKRPILRNVSTAEIQAFREQVQIIDMVECENPDELSVRIEALAPQAPTPCGCCECGEQSSLSISTAPQLVVTAPSHTVTMDKAGYFVIVPVADRKVINVEHYSYDNTLLRVIEGTEAQAIYHKLISDGWVTELSHAAYLGRELAKAELALQYGFKYIQDGA